MKKLLLIFILLICFSCSKKELLEKDRKIEELISQRTYYQHEHSKSKIMIDSLSHDNLLLTIDLKNSKIEIAKVYAELLDCRLTNK